jgi:hypothetical protein
LLVIGVIMVGRSPALSQLRAWTEESISALPPLPALPHVPVPHVPVPHVPALPRGRAGRRAERGEDDAAESDDDPDGGAPRETADADAEREMPPPPGGTIITIVPPETGGASSAVQPDMRGLLLPAASRHRNLWVEHASTHFLPRAR